MLIEQQITKRHQVKIPIESKYQVSDKCVAYRFTTLPDGSVHPVGNPQCVYSVEDGTAQIIDCLTLQRDSVPVADLIRVPMRESTSKSFLGIVILASTLNPAIPRTPLEKIGGMAARN